MSPIIDALCTLAIGALLGEALRLLLLKHRRPRAAQPCRDWPGWLRAAADDVEQLGVPFVHVTPIESRQIADHIDHLAANPDGITGD